MNISLTRAAVSALALTVCGAIGAAQIERLDLNQMVAKTDNSIVGEIIASKVFRVDDAVDGNDLFYTTITIQGRSLVDGKLIEVPVTFPGGFISPEVGVHNSEAPTADEIRVGNEVVAFFKWTDNMGGQVAGNALYASHGGIYRVVQSGQEFVTLGKGEGYAIGSNMKLKQLDAQITLIHDQLKK